MTNFPFGFGPGAGAGQPEDLGAAFQQLGKLLSWQGGPVNWDLATDLARQAVSASGDRSVSASDRRAVIDALRLAELWLDPATVFAASSTAAQAWSRAEWVEHTMTSWRALVDPVAGRVVESLANLIGSAQGPLGQLGLGQLGLAQPGPGEPGPGAPGPGEPGGLPPALQGIPGLPDLSALTGQMQQMMASMGGAMFGAQVGQALGGLAVEVMGSTDVGLPMGPPGTAALVPANVAAFGEGLGVPEDQVRLYLALREAAHHRLYAHVPWLRAHIVEAVAAYARGIMVDTSELEEAMGRIDPMNPEALQQALTGGLFEPQDTPEQKASLARLETALALVEGWVDEVVDAAATPHLPGAGALRETVRRQRATGGPAEQTFASLVGLELRPRRLREAAALWRAVLATRGVEGRDAVWAHPDLLPTASDLDDPEGFAAGGSAPLDLSGLDATTAPPEPDDPAAPLG